MSGFDDIEATLMEKNTYVKPSINYTQDFKVNLFKQDQYTLIVKLSGKSYKYEVLEDDEILDAHTSDKKPGNCNKDTQFVKGFIKKLTGKIKTLNENVPYPVDHITDEVMKQLRRLQKQLDDYEIHKEELQRQELIEKQEERLKEVDENYNQLNELLEENNCTIIDFIQVCITYLINGENKNVLIAYLCHLSTYFKRGPLWFMAVGKSGEGKSTIEKASIDLLPPDAYMNGNMTKAAVYRKTLNDGENFLDGKIMRFGDLGGKDDFKKNEEILDVYKQSSTEGIVELEVTSEGVNEEFGERDTTKFSVKGYCSVSFATVHSEDIDEQYRNRGRLVEPEGTNDHVRKYRLYNKGKYANHVEDIIDKYINILLHEYIEYIHLKYIDLQVFNPYQICLHNWLEEDEYFKRSIGQYEKLVETVTILNAPNRDRVCNSEGDMFIVSTRDDNELVTRLFIPSFGLSPVAIRLFNKLLDWFFKQRSEVNGKLDCNVEEYVQSVNDELNDYQAGVINTSDFISSFTVAEIKHRVSKTSSLKGVDVGGIVNNLVQLGYIIPSDVKVNKSNKNIYHLNYFDKINNRKIDFDDECINFYLGEVVPVTYGDIGYVPPAPSVEMKNIENADKLRECFIGELGVARWF